MPSTVVRDFIVLIGAVWNWGDASHVPPTIALSRFTEHLGLFRRRHHIYAFMHLWFSWTYGAVYMYFD